MDLKVNLFLDMLECFSESRLCQLHCIAEALVIVREAHQRHMSEALDRFHSSYGIRLKFTLFPIKDQSAEELGTADALREAASRNMIKVLNHRERVVNEEEYAVDL